MRKTGLGGNLALEVLTLGAGKGIEVALPYLRAAVRAPAYMAAGMGIGGFVPKAGRAVETGAEAGRAVEAGAAEVGAVEGGATRGATESAGGAPSPAPGNPELAPGGSARPVTKGRIGEEAKKFEAGGVKETVIGEQVTLQSTVEVNRKFHRIRIDVVSVTEEGVLKGYEVKFGEFAELTPNQRIVIPPGGGYVTVIPRGARAVEAGLVEGEPVRMLIDIRRYSWPVN